MKGVQIHFQIQLYNIMESTNTSSDQYSTSSSGQDKTNESGGFNMDNLTDMLGGMNIQESLKKYGSSASRAINVLSTTQKVIGGAILLLGATYLTRKKGVSGLLSKVGSLSKMGKKKNGR